MNASAAVIAAAVTFTWLGMVLAISFLEAPLKFLAPGVTITIGLSIGRLVFRALNLVEAVLAVTVIAAVIAGSPPADVTAFTVAAAALLVTQLGVIRPRLNRRSSRVLAGEHLPRSPAHLYYVGSEIAKAITLAVLGTSILLGAGL